LLAVFYIPLFFVIVRRTARDALKRLHGEGTAQAEGAA
jgi:multidrug efflux pump